MSNKELISQSEAARMLGTSRQYVNKLVNNGKLTIHVVAGIKLVDKTEVIEMMNHAETA